MLLLSFLFISSVIVSDFVNANLDICTSNYLSETDCVNEYSNNNTPCYWDEYLSECVTINCGDFNTEDTCNNWSQNYGCQWFSLNDTSYGDIGICHSSCPQNLDLIFTVDVSSSVMNSNSLNNNNNHNDELTRDYITIMKLWWNIQKLINQNVELVEHTIRFGLIYYAKRTSIYFDLEFGLSLNDYIFSINELFNHERNSYYNNGLYYYDDTDTVNALQDAFIMFEDSVPYPSIYGENDNIKTNRLIVLITGGTPTLPAYDPAPCSDTYDLAQKFFNGINGGPIQFFGALVGIDSTSASLLCFEEYYGTITEISDYNQLNNAIPGIYFGSPICITEETTTTTTASPTNNPTITLPIYVSPTGNPTPKPTYTRTSSWWSSRNVPSDSPTNANVSPTESPTPLYVAPTDLPTNVYIPPTSSPTPIYIAPTQDPTNKPTESPTNVYIPPTQSPTPIYVSPTQSPTNINVLATESPSNTYISPTKITTVEPTPRPTFSKTSAWWGNKGTPTTNPTNQYTLQTTAIPTKSPTNAYIPPTNKPSESPTPSPIIPYIPPTESPTDAYIPGTESPTNYPTWATPTHVPTNKSSESPTLSPTNPYAPPTESPTQSYVSNSDIPTNVYVSPTNYPTWSTPTDTPKNKPSESPTPSPTNTYETPTLNATSATPTNYPSNQNQHNHQQIIQHG